MGASGNAVGLEQSVTLPGESEDAADAEAKLYYLFDKDIQGSTTSLLNSEGEGTVSYEYTDFGETTIHESVVNQAENAICYTGGIYDESTGLYYLNARYYDPDLGIFLTEDSYRGETGSVDTWNLYAYCNGNPVNYVDPSGHKYSPNKAAKYAVKWANRRNPMYPRFGADCTNFVSQCIYAGGVKMTFPKRATNKSLINTTNYWYSVRDTINSSKDMYRYRRTSSWSVVRDFDRYWKSHGAKISEFSNFNKLKSKVKIGDVIQLYSNKSSWFHFVIITSYKNKKYRYCAHTMDRKDMDINKLKDGASRWKIFRFS